MLSLPYSGQLFHRLDVHKSGVVLVDDVSKFFNKRDGLPVGRGQRSGTEVWEDLLECLFGRVTSISYEVGPELRGGRDKVLELMILFMSHCAGPRTLLPWR